MARKRLAVALIVSALGVALFPASVLAAGEAETKVINGLEAAHGTFPYMAFIAYEGDNEEGFCSGTVVSSNVVLTAAHCVLTPSRSAIRIPADFAVVTGNVNWTSPERTVSRVSRIAVAPNLTYLVPSFNIIRGDAAVLQLTQPISSPPVKLATYQSWAPGSGALMVGWGRTQLSQPGPVTLHFGETVIQEANYCHSEEPYFESSQLICTLDYPSEEWTTCYGDSGGPLLRATPGTSEVVEIGITSFGNNECSTEDAAFFTNALAIGPWVNTKVAEYAPSAPPPAPVVPAPKTTSPVAPILPRLTNGAARHFVTRSLLEGMSARFRGRRSYRNSCKEVHETKQRCFVTWFKGGTDYWGYVTIYYALDSGRVVWNDRYTVKAVNNYCYYESGHRSSCPITTFRR